MSIRLNALGSGLLQPAVQLMRPDEMAANPNHGKADEASLILSWTKRFPAQPAWPAYPPALLQDGRLVHPMHDRSKMRMIDQVFWQITLAHSRADAIEKRSLARHQVEMKAAHAHAEHIFELETRQRAHFFRTVYHIMVSREKGHVKARRLELALWNFLREHTVKRGDHEAKETRRLIKEGFARHAAFLEWRLDNLWGMTDTHGIIRLKHHGQMLEAVVGRVLADLRRVVTEKHHDWRLDTLYMPLVNGGFAHVHHSGGKPLEHVAAEAHWPEVRKRTEAFERWHDSNNLIMTPNHSLVHMHHQGHMPEEAFAKLAKPRIEERIRRFLDWHLSHLMTPLANGGFAPTKSHNGVSPEKATGDVAWHGKRDVTHRHRVWHLSGLTGPTPNGGMAPLMGHGQATEKVSADLAKPRKEHVTQLYRDWHQSHLAGATPNGGMAPLKGHGRAPEAVAAEIREKPRHERKEAFRLWHATHQYRETANHGMAPSKTTGLTFEALSGKLVGRMRDKVTQHLMERRLNTLYVATANGSWHRVENVGKPLEAVANEVMPPASAPDGPLPSKGGQPLASAKLQIAHKRRHEEKRAFREIQRSLAAHEETVSRMQGHVILPSSVDHATNPDTLPARGPDKPKKAV